MLLYLHSTKKISSPNTGVRIAELLLLSGKYHVINYVEFLQNGSNVVAAFKGHNTMKMTLLHLMVMNLNTDSMTPEESEELFTDLEENESEVENFDICDVRKIRKKHLLIGSIQVALYIRCNWL